MVLMVGCAASPATPEQPPPEPAHAKLVSVTHTGPLLLTGSAASIAIPTAQAGDWLVVVSMNARYGTIHDMRAAGADDFDTYLGAFGHECSASAVLWLPFVPLQQPASSIELAVDPQTLALDIFDIAGVTGQPDAREDTSLMAAASGPGTFALDTITSCGATPSADSALTVVDSDDFATSVAYVAGDTAGGWASSDPHADRIILTLY